MRLGKLSAFMALLAACRLSPAQNPDSLEFFESRIRPVLADNCFGCHNGKLKTAGLDLSVPEGARGKGEKLIEVLSYGAAVKMPPMGKLKEQQIADITAWVKAGAPWPHAPAAVASGGRFTAEQKAFWSFQPVQDYPAPEVRDKAWVQSPIDAFILARLEQKNLKPAPPADKRTLIRRATFDLTGLPPTPQEIDAFLGDHSPDAFAKLVERLLASPRYGERWGRHWLDVARYADSTGADEDIRYPYAWRYRDYVIDAFNRDLPYDRFIQEQLAGDLMPGEKAAEVNVPGIVATGFLAVGLKLLAEQDKPKMVYDMIDEQLDTTSRAFMGLTVACARCHDHKFDPIPTKDYYSLAGFFAGTKSLSKVEGTVSQLYFAPLVSKEEYEVYENHQKRIRSKQKEIQAVESAEAARHISALLPRLAEYMVAAQEHAQPKNLDPAVLQRWVDYLKPSDDIRPHLEAWFKAAAAGPEQARAAAAEYQTHFARTAAEWEKTLADWRAKVAEAVAERIEPPDKPTFEAGKDRFFASVALEAGGPFATAAAKEPHGKQPASHRNPLYPAEANQRLTVLDSELTALRKAAPPEPPMACGVTEGLQIEQHVLIRGNVQNPGEIAPRQFLEIIAGEHQQPIRHGSGRLELARWLASPRHPLTARVMVNRIWQYHFGQGLVRTPNNFGLLGERPTHPELLDFLARRFIEKGWSIKAMHRLLMLSSTYQMSSRITREQAEADPGNLLLSHFSRRRLDVEEIRDGLLALDGALDLTMGGTLQKGFGTDGENSADRLSISPASSRRRTVYLPLRRSNLPSLLNLFDFGDATTPGEGRENTNVAPQALYMMNSKFLSERSQSLARKLLADAPSDAAARLREAFLLLYGRPPSGDEERDLLAYAGAFREKAAGPELSVWQSICHILMGSNEYIYVD